MRRDVWRTSLGIGDQALCSLSNFLLFILVARAATKSEVGIYAVLFALLTMSGGVQNALVTQPMKIFGAGIAGQERDFYFAGVFGLQVATAAVMALVLATGVGMFIGWGEGAAFAGGCLGYQVQQYCRARFIALTSMGRLVACDLLAHGPRIVAAFALAMAGALDAKSALWVVGLTSLASLVLGVGWGSRSLAELGAVARRHWRFGRWLLLETVTFYSSTHLYVILVAVFLGAAVAGAFGAVQNLVNAANVVSMGIVAVAPTLARKQVLAAGYPGWRASITALLGLNTLLVGLIVLVFAIWGELLLATFYGTEYQEHAALIVPLGLVAVLAAINGIGAVAFRVIEKPQVGAVAKTVSGAISIGLAPVLLVKFGLTGAVAGLLVTQLIWLAWYLGYISVGPVGPSYVDGLRRDAGSRGAEPTRAGTTQ